MGDLASSLVLGPGALVAVALYLLSMIGIGWLGRLSRKSNSLADFYLAGGSMGFVVLFLTLYATQYSGNTLFGYTGITYRIGYQWTVSVLFMHAIVIGYLLFAPRLVILAKAKGFITPGDFIQFRFGSRILTTIATLLMIYALGNYTLAQLKAMGAAVEGLTDGMVASSYGIIGLALIMVVYETLGGMRSVAWTDVLQGIVLLIGFAILLFMVPGLAGGLSQVVHQISISDPEKITAPSFEATNSWISFIILLGCGAAIYPQAIQRLYASRSVRELKHSLSLMAFMPFTTTMIALVCGISGIVLIPGLAGVETDQVLARVCALIMEDSLIGYWLVVVVFAAALAALMSTADSALLSISSMFTKDIYKVFFSRRASQAELTHVGKICSWVVIALLVIVAILTDKTLVRLLELKFEVLIQIVPCFFFGLYWRRLDHRVVLTGLFCGLAVALGLTWAGYPRVWGFHAGVLGFGLNAAVCALGVLYLTRVAEVSK